MKNFKNVCPTYTESVTLRACKVDGKKNFNGSPGSAVFPIPMDCTPFRGHSAKRSFVETAIP